MTQSMDHNSQTIVADISMYPLTPEYVPAIIAFIKSLNERDGLEIVTNQLSTHLKGPHDIVTAAISDGMKEVMAGPDKVVFAVKYLNADLDIKSLPDLE